jgi:SAM-dependent methyltransferase
MERKLTFNEDAANYDRWRPCYCEELFAEIIRYARPDAGKVAVEMGCGTGQATEPILKTGCTVTAVEYGENLAAFALEKFSGYENFRVQIAAFEDFACESGSLDLLYSATAFHWVPEEIGYPKAYDLLKPGGTLALFWNAPFCARPDGPAHREIQAAYARRGEPSAESRPEDDLQLRRVRADTILKYGFVALRTHIFKRTRVFDADGYICLLNTYSDHRVRPEREKSELEADIKAAVNRFGGVLKIYDTMDLYLARKPENS